MKALWKPLLASALLLSLGQPTTSWAGTRDGGGLDDAFPNATTNIRDVQTNLVRTLSGITDATFQDAMRPFQGHPVARRDLIAVLKALHLEPLESAVRRRPDGKTVPLLLDYRRGETLGESYVIVLGRFFDRYDMEGPSPSDEEAMAEAILHEASHLFGFGIGNDETDSVKVSEALLALVAQYEGGCGLDGSVAERVAECGPKQERDGWQMVTTHVMPGRMNFFATGYNWYFPESSYVNWQFQIFRNAAGRLIAFLPKNGVAPDSEKVFAEKVLPACGRIHDSGGAPGSWHLPTPAQAKALFNERSIPGTNVQTMDDPQIWTSVPFVFASKGKITESRPNFLFPGNDRSVICVK